MVDIIHRIGIKASPAQVYEAVASLKGLGHWWTEEVRGDAGLKGRIDFTFRTPTGEIKGQMAMEVQELNAPKSVRWRCVDGPPEWVGTEVTFQLTQEDGQTILIFGHRKWREAVEFTAHCSMKWAVFLLSLREYVETGKGRPSPVDLKIDNWN
jgi:uncharacterized protein YndB with AHSA1/START domain